MASTVSTATSTVVGPVNLTSLSNSKQYKEAFNKATEELNGNSIRTYLLIDRAFPYDVKTDNIAVNVVVHLEREHDRENPDRVALADRVKESFESEFAKIYTGDANSAEYVLDVVLTIASDGSPDGRNFGIIPAGELNIGLIKLSAAFVLSNADRTRVYKAGRAGRTDGMKAGFADIPGKLGLDKVGVKVPTGSDALVNRIAPHLPHDIAKLIHQN